MIWKNLKSFQFRPKVTPLITSSDHSDISVFSKSQTSSTSLDPREDVKTQGAAAAPDGGQEHQEALWELFTFPVFPTSVLAEADLRSGHCRWNEPKISEPVEEEGDMCSILELIRPH